MRRRLAGLSCTLGMAIATTAAIAAVTATAPASAAPAASAQAVPHAKRAATIAPKVMIVTLFAPEAQAWLDHLGPWRDTAVPGLSPDYPAVHCNRAEVCVVTLGMGHSNAAASMMALVLAHEFDLSRTYFLVAGIAGINPEQGTLGSTAWARYLVDFGLQWEIDAREIPAGWNSGYLGINTKGGDEKPPLDYRTEVFQVGSSRVDLQACKLEYSIVSPK